MKAYKRVLAGVLAFSIFMSTTPLTAYAEAAEEPTTEAELQIETETQETEAAAEPAETEAGTEPAAEPETEATAPETEPAAAEAVTEPVETAAETEPAVTEAGTEPTEAEETTPMEVLKYMDFLYAAESDGVVVLGYEGEAPDEAETVTALVIPESIDGAPVVGIGEDAFACNTFIDAILLPETVVSVGDSAFENCSDLKAVAFCGEALEFGETVADNSSCLEKVFALDRCDLTWFRELLEEDLGEDGAEKIEFLTYEHVKELEDAFDAYAVSLAPEAPQETAEETEAAEMAEEVPEADESVEFFAESEDPDLLASGSCGENLTWTLSADGLLEISGDGPMDDFISSNSDEISSAPWGSYLEQITELKLNEGITTIGDQAFMNCTNLAGTLELPSTLTSIGFAAFAPCHQLNGTLTLPEGLTAIETDAFFSCGFEGELRLPDSLETIGSGAFSYCFALTSVTVGENVGSIDVSLGEDGNAIGPFNGCGSLETVTFTGSVPPSAENNLFAGMDGLRLVYVPVDAKTAYREAYGQYLPETVILRGIGEEPAADDNGFVVEDGILTEYRERAAALPFPIQW